MPRHRTYKHRDSLAGNIHVTRQFLASRIELSRRLGFPAPPRWVTFSSTLLSMGLTVHLYAAKSTYSKYLYVSLPSQPELGTIKIRFSDHAPGLQDSFEPSDYHFYPGALESEPAILLRLHTHFLSYETSKTTSIPDLPALDDPYTPPGLGPVEPPPYT